MPDISYNSSRQCYAERYMAFAAAADAETAQTALKKLYKERGAPPEAQQDILEIPFVK